MRHCAESDLLRPGYLQRSGRQHNYYSVITARILQPVVFSRFHQLYTESTGLARHGKASPKTRGAKGGTAHAVPVVPCGQVGQHRRLAQAC